MGDSQQQAVECALCSEHGVSGIEPITETTEWPQPLCRMHYKDACARPPRTILVYLDGHKEMRNSFVYGKLYKDIEKEFDESTGELYPVRSAWFAHDWTHRDDKGKPVMLCYREIPDPTPKVVRKANAALNPAPSPATVDWQGAFQLAMFFAAAGILVWLLATHWGTS